MALQNNKLLVLNKTMASSASLPLFPFSSPSSSSSSSLCCKQNNYYAKKELRFVRAAIDRSTRGGGSKSSGSGSINSNGGKKGVPDSNYFVPLDKSLSSTNSSCITRPLFEILRDLNKRILDSIITNAHSDDSLTFIPWYHANRMLSFYAPGWCGEIRDVLFSNNGGVTVVYRLTIRGSDAEAYRESSGTVSSTDSHIVDPVAAAEEIAFCKACARFGLGLYLYHEE